MTTVAMPLPAMESTPRPLRGRSRRWHAAPVSADLAIIVGWALAAIAGAYALAWTPAQTAMGVAMVLGCYGLARCVLDARPVAALVPLLVMAHPALLATLAAATSGLAIVIGTAMVLLILYSAARQRPAFAAVICALVGLMLGVQLGTAGAALLFLAWGWANCLSPTQSNAVKRPWRRVVIPIGAGIVAATAGAALTDPVTLQTVEPVLPPLAGLDRFGWIPHIQRLPIELGATTVLPYVGWAYVLLACTACWPQRQPGASDRRGVAATILFAPLVLWALRGSDIHHQLRSWFSEVIVRLHVPAETLNRTGIVVLGLVLLAGLVFLAWASAIAGCRRWNATSLTMAGILTMLWWRAAPTTAFGVHVNRIHDVAGMLLPVTAIALAIGAGAGLQRIARSGHHTALRWAWIVLALVGLMIDVAPWQADWIPGSTTTSVAGSSH